jgi:Plasmid replication region DNA-binding N-term
MARLGLTDADIQLAIQALEAEGVPLTVSTIRSRLGSGSFSTISAVLRRHRDERDRSIRAVVPELPQPILGMFEQLWAEAYRRADAIADAERQSHAQEKAVWEKAAAEMQTEIERLEKAMADNVAQIEEVRTALAAKTQALQGAELEKVRFEAALTGAQTELQQARDSSLKIQEQLTSWVERATRAETRLETTKKDKTKGG